MHQVFISYSTVDAAKAETVRNVLERNEIRCWMAPRDIPVGSNYTKEIPVAIRDCQVFVLVLSQNAQRSHWVLKELDSAVNMGKVILPFMLEDCVLNDEFNFLLTGAQRYAAYQKKAEAMETLIRWIRSIIQEPSAPAPEDVPVFVPPVPAPKAAPEEKPWLGFAQCPACGGTDLEELKKKTGRFTPKEWLPAVLIPLFAVAGYLVLLMVATFLSYTFFLFDILGDVLVLLVPLVGAGVGAWLGKRIGDNWIRRQRIRRQVLPHPFRCKACQKTFLREKDA